TRVTAARSRASYSADGNWLVIARGLTDSSGWVSVCDSRTGLEWFSIPIGPAPAYSASLSPDGTSLLAVEGPSNPSDFYAEVYAGRNELRAWDTKSRTIRFVLHGHTKPVMSACFSPDGRLIASGGYDATVRIWDATNGRELHTLRGHQM